MSSSHLSPLISNKKALYHQISQILNLPISISVPLFLFVPDPKILWPDFWYRNPIGHNSNVAEKDSLKTHSVYTSKTCYLCYIVLLLFLLFVLEEKYFLHSAFKHETWINYFSRMSKCISVVDQRVETLFLLLSFTFLAKDRMYNNFTWRWSLFRQVVWNLLPPTEK